MHVINKDLNLLVLFDVLMTERSVSAAAKRMHLSQSAVSHALARLRLAFGDDLFVRTARGVTPTPEAFSLAPKVAEALAKAEAVFTTPEHFDPAKAEGRLIMASTELFEHLALPRLIPRLAVEAPKLTLLSTSGLSQLPKDALMRGDVDVAVAGFFEDLPEGFCQEPVFDDHFVCVLRRGHRFVREPLTLDAYLTLDHLLVSPQGDLYGTVDRALAKMNLRRRLVAGVSNFLTPGLVVAESDMVVTIPSRIAALYQAYDVVVVPLPLAVPGISVIQVWHERTTGSPLHVWFRRLLQEVVHIN